MSAGLRDPLQTGLGDAPNQPLRGPRRRKRAFHAKLPSQPGFN